MTVSLTTVHENNTPSGYAVIVGADLVSALVFLTTAIFSGNTEIAPTVGEGNFRTISTVFTL
jgi:hypothetical protein